jgi:hypothetical protein
MESRSKYAGKRKEIEREIENRGSTGKKDNK